MRNINTSVSINETNLPRHVRSRMLMVITVNNNDTKEE